MSRRFGALGVAVALTAGTVFVSTTASATPTQRARAHRTSQSIDSVQKRLEVLHRRSDLLVERYLQAVIAADRTETSAHRAAASYAAARHRLDAASVQMSTSAAAQYEGGAFSATGALLSSDSGSSYLDQLDTLSMLSQHNAQLVSSFAANQRQAAQAEAAAAALAAKARTMRDALAAQRTSTQHDIGAAQRLLASLDVRQRKLLAAIKASQVVATAPSTVTTVRQMSVGTTSSAAKAAVQFALAQVGKPYVFGAAGPSAYDCSGLTMMAWQAGGVSLPHSAEAQYGYGHHVSFDQMQPGDLMFFYSPIGHVSIYIGNGLMVSAPQESEPVKIVAANQFGSDFVGATRLVG